MGQPKPRWRDFLEFVLDEIEAFAEPLRTLLVEAIANVAAGEVDHERWVCCRLEYLDVTGATDYGQTLDDFVARRLSIGNAWRGEPSN